MQFERELRLGGLLLAGPGSELQPSGCSYATVAKGVKFGSAEAEKSIAKAFGGRGSRVSVSHWDNATTVFMVEISGPDAVTLAEGQAALERVLPDGSGDPVPLLWRPHPEAPAAIRDVVYAEMIEQYDDDTEARKIRVFQLTLTHKPFVRSEFVTTLPPKSASSTGVVSDVITPGGTRPTALSVNVNAAASAEVSLTTVCGAHPVTGAIWNPDWLGRSLSNAPHATPSGASGASWTPLGTLVAGSAGLREWAGAFAVFVLVRYRDTAVPPANSVPGWAAVSQGGVQRGRTSLDLRNGVSRLASLGVVQMGAGENWPLGDLTVTGDMSGPYVLEIGGLFLVPVRSGSSAIALNRLGAARVFLTPKDGYTRVRVSTTEPEADAVAPSRGNIVAGDELTLQPGANGFYTFAIRGSGLPPSSMTVLRSFTRRWSSNPADDGATP